MACIRIRRGRYVVDWLDKLTKRRRWASYPLTEEGHAKAEAALKKVREFVSGAVDPTVTLEAYIEYWLGIVAQRVGPQTLVTYTAKAALIPPGLRRMRVSDLRRATLKAWLSSLSSDYARGTVGTIHAVVSILLNEAVDDGLLETNPAAHLKSRLGLEADKDTVRAMTQDQLQTFLSFVREEDDWPTFAVLAYAGLRSGEAVGLQLGDVDLERRQLSIERQVYKLTGGIGPPKRKKKRLVAMADELRDVLTLHVSQRREQDMRIGRRSPWLLFPWMTEVPDRNQAARAEYRIASTMRTVLDRSGLPEHFTPHSLRHTYVRVLLEKGENLLYVARQIGDTLAVTERVYGRWATVPASAGGANLLTVRRKKEEEEG